MAGISVYIVGQQGIIATKTTRGFMKAYGVAGAALLGYNINLSISNILMKTTEAGTGITIYNVADWIMAGVLIILFVLAARRLAQKRSVGFIATLGMAFFLGVLGRTIMGVIP